MEIPQANAMKNTTRITTNGIQPCLESFSDRRLDIIESLTVKQFEFLFPVVSQPTNYQ